MEYIYIIIITYLIQMSITIQPNFGFSFYRKRNFNVLSSKDRKVDVEHLLWPAQGL